MGASAKREILLPLGMVPGIIRCRVKFLQRKLLQCGIIVGNEVTLSLVLHSSIFDSLSLKLSSINERMPGNEWSLCDAAEATPVVLHYHVGLR